MGQGIGVTTNRQRMEPELSQPACTLRHFGNPHRGRPRAPRTHLLQSPRGLRRGPALTCSPVAGRRVVLPNAGHGGVHRRPCARAAEHVEQVVLHGSHGEGGGAGRHRRTCPTGRRVIPRTNAPKGTFNESLCELQVCAPHPARRTVGHTCIWVCVRVRVCACVSVCVCVRECVCV
jgi:hypothetical protein